MEGLLCEYTWMNLIKYFYLMKKILFRLKTLNIKTKNGKEITHKDLRKAISVMIHKHPSCICTYDTQFSQGERQELLNYMKLI